MTTSSPQPTRFKKPSYDLKTANMTEKYNSMLEQVLYHIHSFDAPNGGNSFLEEEGTLRQSGNQEHMNIMMSGMISDPTKNSLEKYKEYTLFTHTVAGLVKKGLREWNVDWSDEANASFKEFLNNPSMSFYDLTQDLMKKNAVEEARILHNLLHMCHIVLQHQSKNKMGANNIHTTFAPSLAIFVKQRLALDPSTQASAYNIDTLNSGAHRLINAFKDPSFRYDFAKTYPEQQMKLEESYAAKFSPTGTKPARKGIETYIPSPDVAKSYANKGWGWLKSAFNTVATAAKGLFATVKGLFSKWFGGKGKSSDVSVPTNVTQVGAPSNVQKAMDDEAIKRAYKQAAEINPDFSPDTAPDASEKGVKTKARDWDQRIQDEKKPIHRQQPYRVEESQKMEKGEFKEKVKLWEGKAKVIQPKDPKTKKKPPAK
jgi:hypothetical protein